MAFGTKETSGLSLVIFAIYLVLKFIVGTLELFIYMWIVPLLFSLMFTLSTFCAELFDTFASSGRFAGDADHSRAFGVHLSCFRIRPRLVLHTYCTLQNL
jgi:hypothetical protein